MAMRPGAREPSIGSTCSDLFIALWNATRSVLQRPWWAVGACSRSSSHSVHVVVVVEAHEQDDAEKFASCLLIMCTRARHVLATRSRVSICVESVWVETRGRVPTQERTGVRATCVLVVSLACLRRPPALIARRGVREMMAPRKHEGVLPLQRVRGERGRVAGRGVVSGCATGAAVPQLALHSCLWTHCIRTSFKAVCCNGTLSNPRVRSRC